ncbi:DNA-binding protein snt1, partial [Massospora cicadina]
TISDSKRRTNCSELPDKEKFPFKFKCFSAAHLAELVEQGKRAIGPVHLQRAILQYLLQTNAFSSVPPSDFTTQPYYMENTLRFQEKRVLLVKKIAQRKRMLKQKQYQASKEYKRLHDEWQGRSTRTYGSRKSRHRGQEDTHYYKFHCGDVVRSEKEFLETLQSLASADNVSQGIVSRCTSADIPPMAPHSPRPMNNSNGLILDPKIHFFRGSNSDRWSEREKAQFVKAYLQFPKQFGKIAEALPEKTPAQCVLFYYRTKKLSDLKGQLGKKRKAELLTKRRINSLGRRNRGREKDKQSSPYHDSELKQQNKEDQHTPSPVSSSSHDQLDVVGDKDVTKSDYLADDSLIDPDVQEIDIEDIPAGVAAHESSALSPFSTPEVAHSERPKQPSPSSEVPGVRAITKINALLNSPTGTAESKWDKSAIIEWFGGSDDSSALISTSEPPVYLSAEVPVRPSLPFPSRPLKPIVHAESSNQMPYCSTTSYISSDARQPTTQIWSHIHMPTLPLHPMVYSMPHQSSFHQVPYQNLSTLQPQPYSFTSYPCLPDYSYRENIPKPHLHQPILSRAPTEPPSLHPVQTALSASETNSQNSKADSEAPSSASLTSKPT